jgi:lysosomal Pro-X carboxypeptidase
MQSITSYPLFFCCWVLQFSWAISAATCLKYPVRQFTQTLNHASSDNTTFQQSYQLDISRFKPGGPILFYQGAEIPTINCVEYNHFDDIAGELGAIVAGLEHRFFGDSFPVGVSAANVTGQDFAPLTLDNVLLDSATFVEWIKRQFQEL